MPGPDGPVDWPDLEAMALRLVETGVSTLAVVHFPAGCVAAASGRRIWRQGSVWMPREQVRSTTGGKQRADACLAAADAHGRRPTS